MKQVGPCAPNHDMTSQVWKWSKCRVVSMGHEKPLHTLHPIYLSVFPVLTVGHYASSTITLSSMCKRQAIKQHSNWSRTSDDQQLSRTSDYQRLAEHLMTSDWSRTPDDQWLAEHLMASDWSRTPDDQWLKQNIWWPAIEAEHLVTSS